MSHESTSNNHTSIKSITQEIKQLKAQCVNTFNINENNRLMEMRCITPENANEKTLCYVEGLRTNIKNAQTEIISDENILTGRFLAELKLKTGHLEDLIAFTKGSIIDIDTEIESLKTHIQIAQEIKTRTNQKKQMVEPEHLEKAKTKFREMKQELQGLIRSLFPHCAEEITDILKELMSARSDPETSDYIPITTENYKNIELLKDMDLVSVNPYNNTEVKIVD